MSHTCAIAKTPEEIDGLLKANACVIHAKGNDTARVYVKGAYKSKIFPSLKYMCDCEWVLDAVLLAVVDVYGLEPEMIKQYVLMLLNPDEYM